MNLEFAPIVLPLLAAAGLNLALTRHVWVRRRFPGAVMFGTCMAALAEWSIAYAFVIAGADPDTKMLWYRAEYIGVVASCLTWALFALQYAGCIDRLRSWPVALLCAEPVLALLLVWTNSLHGTFWPSWGMHQEAGFKALDVTFGQGYWINVVYEYVLVLGGSIVLGWTLARQRRLYVLQAASLVVGVCAPMIGNLAYNTGIVGSLDLAPFAFTLSGVSWWLAFARYRVLDVAPVATPVALESVFESMLDGVLVLDAAGSVIKLNPTAAQVLQVSNIAAQQDALRQLMGDLPCTTAADAAQPARAEIALGNGAARRHYDLHFSPIWHRSGALAGRIVALRDVTDRRRAEEALAHQARHDALTGLPNRALLLDRLSQAIELSVRDQVSVALLFVDLDNFKTINDSLGHAAGDELLVMVADRLRSCLRAGDMVARLGGDEFALILSAGSDAEAGRRIARRIIEALRHPFALGTAEVVIGTSIGIALTSEQTTRPGDLLRNADTALYAAKGQGRGRFEFFVEDMYRAAQARLELLADLRRAVANDEFEVYYQPIVNLRSGAIIGAEALVRWIHPERGVVSPLTFIPLCEEVGLIVPLGESVLRKVSLALSEWQQRFPHRQPLSISVNVSPRQLQEPGFVDRLRLLLQATGVMSDSLVLEITEGVLLDDTEGTLEVLRQIRELGARLAIDDFGTGYSALSYLQRFPIHILKVDRSFVSGLGQGGDRSALVRAIVALAKALNLKLVAEGIESPEQRQDLAALGCEFGQGYLFSQPVPRASFEELLEERDLDPIPGPWSQHSEAERRAA